MNIREITLADRQVYLAMSAEFYSSPAVMHDIPAKFREDAFEEYVKGERAKCFILEDEGSVAGYGIITFYYSQESGGMCVLFDELYVRKEYRSRGFGHAYFEYVFKNCPAPRYLLEVEPENVRARALYERLGFKERAYTYMSKDM